MSNEAWQGKFTEPDYVGSIIRFTGNGTGAVTKNFGRGVTVTRTGVGILTIVWDEFPGVFIGIMGWSFSATTASGVKGWTVVPGDYVTSTRTLTINMTNGSDTLADLSSTQQLTMMISFKRTSVA